MTADPSSPGDTPPTTSELPVTPELVVGASSPTELPEPTLEQRFQVKEAMVRLRQEIETAVEQGVDEWRVTTVRAGDVGMVLHEINRLLHVNGGIAKMLCDAQDDVSRLQQEALTADEASKALNAVWSYAPANNLETSPQYNSLMEKLDRLRRISGGSLEETEK